MLFRRPYADDRRITAYRPDQPLPRRIDGDRHLVLAQMDFPLGKIDFHHKISGPNILQHRSVTDNFYIVDGRSGCIRFVSGRDVDKNKIIQIQILLIKGGNK